MGTSASSSSGAAPLTPDEIRAAQVLCDAELAQEVQKEESRRRPDFRQLLADQKLAEKLAGGHSQELPTGVAAPPAAGAPSCASLVAAQRVDALDEPEGKCDCKQGSPPCPGCRNTSDASWSSGVPAPVPVAEPVVLPDGVDLQAFAAVMGSSRTRMQRITTRQSPCCSST